MAQRSPKKPYKQRGRPEFNPRTARITRMLARGIRRDGTKKGSVPQHERPSNEHMNPPQAGL